jgi:hypothetical protein
VFFGVHLILQKQKYFDIIQFSPSTAVKYTTIKKLRKAERWGMRVCRACG